MSRLFRLAALAALTLVAGCTSKADNAKITAATNQFFDQWAGHQYDAIYQGAAPEVTRAMAEPLFVGFLERIDRRLGPCERPKGAMNWKFNATQDGYFSTQGYSTKCANGQLSLSATIVLRQGVAKLAGFEANSPLLLTD